MADVWGKHPTWEMAMKRLLVFSLAMMGCNISQPQQQQPIPNPYPPYVLISCTYWGTSKAGTVLEIKTTCKMRQETGDTWYMDHGEWIPVKAPPTWDDTTPVDENDGWEEVPLAAPQK